jgi:signal transduction histidine kinase
LGKEGWVRMQVSNPPGDLLQMETPGNSETYDVNANEDVALVDREGNVWFADDHGIRRIFYVPFVREELGPKGPAAMAPGDDGAMWIGFLGADKGRLYRVTSRDIQKIDAPNASSWNFGYQAADKTLWFGGANDLWHVVNGKPLPLAIPKELLGQTLWLQAITEDGAGGMWVSFGRHGLYRFADGQWTSYGGHEDLPKTGVIVEFTDRLRRVWFGFTRNQVAVLDGAKVHVFGPDDGVRVGNVISISGRGQNIWIGGEFGLQKLDNGRFRDVQAVDEDWLLGISGIVETAEGDLWLNGLSGIFHIGRAEIAEALSNPSYRVRGQHIGDREGLPGYAAQLRPLPTAVQGSDGKIWFSLTSGVVWLDPTRAQQKALVPPVAIQAVSADDKNYEIKSPLAFPAHTSSVTIRYSAISLSDPQAIRSRVKLRETDADWHQVTTGEPVTYRNLAPGHYHFSVAASDTNGVWSDKVASVDFSILPAWYQTNWFRAVCVFAFILLLWALYQLRLQQLRHQFAIGLEAQVSERTRIARELHDTLLQSFQALLLRFQTVSNLLPARPEEAKTRIDGVIEEGSNAITEGRDAVHELRSAGLTTVDLAQSIRNFAQELLGNVSGDSAPEFGVQVEGTPINLNPVVRDEVYRIVAEATRNAIRHARAKRIEVGIRYDQRHLALRIRDDGNGIDEAVLGKEHAPGHWGLRGMRERAKLIGGSFEIWSKVGSGTEIELKIPAATAYAKPFASGGSFLSRT